MKKIRRAAPKEEETTTDWTMLAVGGIAALGFVIIFNRINISPPEANHIIPKQEVPAQTPQAQTFDSFFMQRFEERH